MQRLTGLLATGAAGWESAAETEKASVYEPAGASMGSAEPLPISAVPSAEGLAGTGRGSAEGLAGVNRGSSEGPAGSGALP